MSLSLSTTPEQLSGHLGQAVGPCPTQLSAPCAPASRGSKASPAHGTQGPCHAGSLQLRPGLQQHPGVLQNKDFPKGFLDPGDRS